MKRLHAILSLLLCLCLLLGTLTGCAGSTKPADGSGNGENTGEETAEDRAAACRAAYETAAEAVNGAANLVMTFRITEERNVGTETVTESSERSARYQNRGSGDMIAEVSETISLGDVRAACRQVYVKDLVYADVKECRFYSRETAEQFLGGQIPAVMLDASRYASLDSEAGEDGTVIRFGEAQSAESWSMPEGGTLLSAEGTATLSGDGALQAMSYEIRYLFGGGTIHSRVEAAVETPEELDLSGAVPENVKQYESLKSVDAAITLLRARVAMEGADVLSINSTETIYSEAAGAYQVQSDTYDAYELLLSEKHTAQAVDLSTQETYSDSYTVGYEDGKLVFTYEDGTDKAVPWSCDATAEYIRLYAMNSFPQYSDLVDASITDVGDYYLIEYAASDSFGKKAEDTAARIMFFDPAYLDNYATQYTTKNIKGTVAVEKATWLPTAVSVNFAGLHTIQGSPYALTMEQNMAISLYDVDTYEAITEEPLPDEEPAVRPTPVFYEVTGEDGARMYLLGTIHVGDDRTAYLPQVVTDAFDSADALAVEFDTEDFTESVTGSEELQELVAQAYYYSDGTGIANHLDSEIYAAAVLLMKVSGNYSSIAERMKPFVWSNTIENFYLSQGRKLTSSKGVDSRLLRLAKGAGKEILNVESGEFQLQLLSGYSDPVQEMMLVGTIAYSRGEYLQGIYELYECWCQGDEQALKEKLAAISEEERAELDEDELAIYDEYHQKMETDRNAGMLEVAEGYLHSGKTVFYAVGLAHLLGEGGLVESLRAKGYTVTPVNTR